jgi:general secretion pathway protein A
MYEAFYKLKEKPFNLTPDPRFIYFTEKHCEALANLVYGIRERKGFLVLSGEVGTGKTTLVNALLDTLERTGVLSAFIFNPILTSTEFFEYLLAEFNLKWDTRSKSQALIKLNSVLLERYRLGQVTVLIIDEAQNLSTEILEEVRLLTNLETATEKLLQIVLVGQPELSLKLNSPELRQLKQRISLRCTLDPLTLSETREYIKTRLEIAGLPDQQIFSDSCIAEVYRCSGGIPRLINSICDNALLTGYACDAKVIGVEIIREVSEDLDLSDGNGHQPRRTQNLKQTLVPGTSNGDSAEGSENLSQETNPEKNRHDSESFDLFVQFVDKLRDRTKSKENA